jgi:hypothetical protein
MYRMTGENIGNIAFLAEQWSEATEAYGVAIEAVETIRAKMTFDSWRQKILGRSHQHLPKTGASLHQCWSTRKSN